MYAHNNNCELKGRCQRLNSETIYTKIINNLFKLIFCNFGIFFVVYLFCVVVLFLPEGLCDDAAVFSELMSCTSKSWCSDPCSCSSVSCDSNKRITRIYGGGKGLTCVPESIGNLTALTYL